VFESNVKIFETDKLVNDPVVAFIEFVVIVPEFDIPVDDIVVVCNVPVFIILLLIVNDPEQRRLLQVVMFVCCDIIIIIYLNFYQNKI
jgi:hypothetical protein